MATFFSLFSSCNNSKNIDNKYLTAVAPKNYANITQFENDDILFLDNPMKNGLESIFSIDNTQDLIIQPNIQTIKEFTPKERLISRLKSIEEETKAPDCNWKNFRIVDQPKEFIFKNYKSAEATFIVDENVNKTGEIIKKKIRRMVIFTDNDLWNIVLAPSVLENYDKEMQMFNEILKSIEIKK